MANSISPEASSSTSDYQTLPSPDQPQHQQQRGGGERRRRRQQQRGGEGGRGGGPAVPRDGHL